MNFKTKRHRIVIFAQVELLLKVIALGWKEYWSSGWNKLDCFLVSLSVVDLAFSYLQSSFLRVVKVLKAQKLLRLLRMTRMVRHHCTCTMYTTCDIN
jgi:Ion transport protein